MVDMGLMQQRLRLVTPYSPWERAIWGEKNGRIGGGEQSPASHFREVSLPQMASRTFASARMVALHR